MNARKVVREPVMVWQSVEASEVGRVKKASLMLFCMKKHNSCLFRNVE